MIPRAALTRIDRVASQGRTGPILSACELDDGSEVEAFVKLSAGCDQGVVNLAREAIAVCLACLLYTSVLARVVGSMPEFKQIIGRGTRLRPDYGKLAFNIIDYTGTATRMFADPAFDGDPVREDEAVINAEGEVVEERQVEELLPDPDDFPEDGTQAGGAADLGTDRETGPRKFYVDGGEVSIVRHLVYELDADGRQLAVRQLTDYTGDNVRTLYPNA